VIRLLIADDEAMVRAGLRLILEAEDDLCVVADAGDGVEAIDAAARFRPDVILMDVRMPRMDGVEACRRLVEGGGADHLRPGRALVRVDPRRCQRLFVEGITA
jgi:YesN/AraC family two-component response regulator